MWNVSKGALQDLVRTASRRQAGQLRGNAQHRLTPPRALVLAPPSRTCCQVEWGVAGFGAVQLADQQRVVHKDLPVQQGAGARRPSKVTWSTNLVCWPMQCGRLSR